MAGSRKTWRRDEIVAAAAHCFMQQGYHATRIDDVAAHLGCTKGRIYHYWPTKTDLFFDVHRAGMARLFAAVDPLPDGPNGAAQLAGLLHAHARAMLDHHTYETVVAQGVQVHRFDRLSDVQQQVMSDLIASRDRFETLFLQALMRGMADGSLACENPSITVKVLLGGLQWSIIWYRPQQGETEQDRADLAAQMVHPLLHGVKKHD